MHFKPIIALAFAALATASRVKRQDSDDAGDDSAPEEGTCTFACEVAAQQATGEHCTNDTWVSNVETCTTCAAAGDLLDTYQSTVDGNLESCDDLTLNWETPGDGPDEDGDDADTVPDADGADGEPMEDGEDGGDDDLPAEDSAASHLGTSAAVVGLLAAGFAFAM